MLKVAVKGLSHFLHNSTKAFEFLEEVIFNLQ